MLRPGMANTPLVTRKSLAGKYLNQEYNQIQLASKVGWIYNNLFHKFYLIPFINLDSTVIANTIFWVEKQDFF